MPSTNIVFIGGDVNWTFNSKLERESPWNFEYLNWLIERNFFEERLTWHLPEKQRTIPIPILKKSHQKMFTGIRFSIGGTKK